MGLRLKGILVVALGVFALSFAPTAYAVSLTVNEIIFSSEGGTDPTNLNGSVEASISDGTNMLTITLKNTSTDASSEDASQLLSGLGITLPMFSIVSGSVKMNGSTAHNFVKPFDGDVSGEWGFDNFPLKGAWDEAFLDFNTGVSSRVSSSDVPFSNNVIAPPTTLDGPEFGLWSKLYSTDPGGQNAIEDKVIIKLNLSGTVANSANFLAALESGPTVLMFGSPDSSTVPEPSATILLGFGLIGLVGYGWIRREQEAVSNGS